MSPLCGKVNEIYARIFIFPLSRTNKDNSSVLAEELLLDSILWKKTSRYPCL